MSKIFLIPKRETAANICGLPSYFFNKILILWSFLVRTAQEMNRTLAPLRRIVRRSVEVLAYSRTDSEKPQSFIVHDHLECGHEFACLGWDVFDLLYAYTDNPEVSARKHRCHPCASLLATRKPVQSVAVAAKAGVA